MMHCNNSKGSRGASAGEFTAPFAIVLAKGLGLMARPAAAAPFAYVTSTDATVSVIDTATNTVVATVKAGLFQDPLLDLAVAVTPDGTLVYAVGIASSVIDAATNKVVYSDPLWGRDRPRRATRLCYAT